MKKLGWNRGFLMAVVLLGLGQVQLTAQVGYITSAVQPGWNLRAFTFISPTETTVPMTIGETPDPGLVVLKATETGFVANNYLNGWDDPSMPILSGEAFFIWNPTNSERTQLFAGGVSLASTNSLPQGYSMVASLLAPRTGPLSWFNFSPPSGSRVYKWDNSSATYQSFTYDGSWSPSIPAIDLAEGFCAFTPSPYQWVQQFVFMDFDPAVYAWTATPPAITSLVGEVNTMTYSTNSQSGRVFDADGVRPVHSAFLGQFYLSTDGSGATFTAVGAPEKFLLGTFAGYLRGRSVKLPGTTDGTTCLLQLRAWEASYGSTYEECVANGGRSGVSANMNIVAHAPVGATGPGRPPEFANSFPNFNVSVGSDLRPRFTEILRQGPSAPLRIILPPGQSFRVYQLDQINSTGWTLVPQIGTITGQGTLTEVPGINLTSNQNRFFRLVRIE